ncbi:MAG: PorT family protein, partial [Bacteroidia bacterium]|nr:PorT family protein [Bacteroidia bacterium]
GFDKAGILLGGGVSTALNNDWEIEMQMTYMQKGSRKNARPDKNDFDYYLLRLNYFEVPLLFNYTQADKMRFEVGPSFGVLLSSFEENEEGEYIGRTKFEDFDLSLNIGMMYSFIENLYVNTRFSNSVLKVRDHGSGAADRLNKGQYNMVLLFGLKYYIPKTSQ